MNDLITEMINDHTGLWNITPQRVEMLRNNLESTSARNRVTIADMLAIADSGDLLWTCKAEYYTALLEIQKLDSRPSNEELRDTLRMIEDSAKKDRVDHREWVKETVSIFNRLIKS